MSTPRVSPGSFSELGPFNWLFTRAASKVMGVDDAHIFSTLGRTGGLFRAWLHFSGRLMPFGALSRRDTEMIIIRVAHLRGSDYELDHHSRIGARVGLDEQTRDRILEGPDAGWGDRERSILRAVDELVADHDLSDITWSALGRHLDEKRLVSFVLLVQQYDGLATTIHALRIQRDSRS